MKKKEFWDNEIKQAKENVGNTNYLATRGISIETAKKFDIGYDPQFKSPKTEKGQAHPSIIVPVSKGHVFVRDIREDDKIPEDEKGYVKQKFSYGESEENWTFNAKALRNAKKPVMVTEGPFDAMSVEECGLPAVAISGVANVKSIVSYIKDNNLDVPIVAMMDNDAEGKKASKQLEDQLHEEGYFCYSVPDISVVYGGKKDPNEALVADREGFLQELLKIQEDAAKAYAQYKEEKTKDYNKAYQASGMVEGFLENVKNMPVPIKTGFERLDTALDGGLRPGLIIIGAESSVGKTTFALQMCDQVVVNLMAKADENQNTPSDIMIISLEMSKYELIAKSLSRISRQIEESKNAEKSGNGTGKKGAEKRNEEKKNAFSMADLMNSKKYESLTGERVDLLFKTVEKYSECAKNIYIVEGNGLTRFQEILDAVENHIKVTGKAPILVIDYLQIISADDCRMTDKQHMDRVVTRLKVMSRDYHIPIIVISSVNRISYGSKINMSSFKESGAIEYSSDVLIALDLIDDEGNNTGSSKDENMERIKKLKSKPVRNIDLTVLKNRNGRTGTVIGYKYIPQFNIYTEVEIK